MYRVLLTAVLLAGCQSSPPVPPPPSDGRASFGDPPPLIPPGSLTEAGRGPTVGGYVEGSAGVYRVR